MNKKDNMKTLSDLVEKYNMNGIRGEVKLLIKYSDTTKNRLIAPRDVPGDPSLEILLSKRVETFGDMFIVKVD